MTRRSFIKKTSIFLAIIVCSQIFANDSITANYQGYLDICQKAAQDNEFLENFRSLSSYRCVLEIEDGNVFAQYIRNRSVKLGKYQEAFRKLDKIGNPTLYDYSDLGFFSPTTLRYIFHADQILKYFTLPTDAKIVEIGAGFGGQAYILEQLHPSSVYYIYDLPEVEALISRMMEVLNVPHVRCLPVDENLPEEKIDLLISNYAYSECDREMQLSYFDRVVKKAERGYLIYNQIAITDYALDSISLNEFTDLLKKNGCQPRVFKEFFAGAGNSLVIWDKTKKK